MAAPGQQLESAPAKKLTAKEVKVKRRRAFELEVAIKQALQAQDDLEWVVAKFIHAFEEGDREEEEPGWRWLGYDSVSEFCAQPEIGMEKSKYYAYVRMWRELVSAGRVREITEKAYEVEVKDDVPQVVEKEVTRVPALSGASPRKVAEVLPAIVKGDVSVKEALSDAKSLGHHDLRVQYRQNNASKQKLDASKEPERAQCPVCNRWADVDELEGYELVDGDLRSVVDLQQKAGDG